MINLWLARYFINFATTFYNLKPLFVWIDLFIDSHQKKKEEEEEKGKNKKTDLFVGLLKMV